MTAFLFPGQGAQYVGMGKDFYDQFPTARRTFEEADDVLERKLSAIIFEGPEKTLTETHNSQTAIFVVSVAILRVLQEQNPDLKATIAAGLSLGEYTALTASGRLPFEATLLLVQKRGELMSRACEETKGTMAVILGLSAEEVEAVVAEVNMPKELTAANFNCPGQVVISGTARGIQAGTEAAKAKGAKRVLPLPVHGAFHSPLMRSAEEGLAPYIRESHLRDSVIEFVMNVPGNFVEGRTNIQENLIRQVTSSVRWEQGIRAIEKRGVDRYVEIGPGKALAGFNKRINTTAPTMSFEKVEDLHAIV